jgi:hypothetical protein
MTEIARHLASTKRREWGKFLRFLALGAFVPIAIKTFIFVVDPLGFNNLIQIERFNAHKHYQSWVGLRYKAFAVRDYRPDGVIFGPSTVQFGFVPQCVDSPLGLSRIYNFGQGGAGPAHLTIHFDDFAAIDTIRRVIFDTRFLLHRTSYDEEIAALENSRIALLRDWLTDKLRPYIPTASIINFVEDPFSLGELQLGLKTIYANATLDRRNLIDAYRPDGSFDPNYARYMAPESMSRDHIIGHISNYWQSFIRKMKPTWSPDLRYLDRVVARAKSAHIALDLFFPPVHVSELMLYNESGSWPLYERFKTALVAKVQRLRKDVGADIRLFDAGILSEITTDPIAQPAKYFQDPVHFRPATGDILLAGILGCQSERSTPTGAVVELTAKTPGEVETHLADERRKLAAYQQAHAELLNLVQKGLNSQAIGPRAW